MTDRIETFHRLADALGHQADDDLLSLIASAEAESSWGTTRTVEVLGHKVFVKCLPVTDLEMSNPASTQNVFGLPAYYSYGIGSAGFGSGRELAASVKTSGWVLGGEIDNFPLLYHHRVLPLAGQGWQIDDARLDRYVEFWDDESIGQFIRARREATHCIAMFSEHFPHALNDWLPQNQHAVRSVVQQMAEATAFLRSRGIAHMDAHWANVVTDGSIVCLTDLGLVLDPEFDLAPDEVDFLARHGHYDLAEFLHSLDPDSKWFPGDPTVEYRAAMAPFRDLMGVITTLFEQLKDGPRVGLYDDEATVHLARRVGLLRESP